MQNLLRHCLPKHMQCRQRSMALLESSLVKMAFGGPLKVRNWPPDKAEILFAGPHRAPCFPPMRLWAMLPVVRHA